MIKLLKGRLRWSDEDMIVMAKILGPEAAAKKQVTPIPSVIKQAQKKGVQLSDKARAILDDSLADRQVLRRIRKADDLALGRYPTDISSMLWAPQRIGLGYIDAFPEKRQSYLIGDQVGVGKTPLSIVWAEHKMRMAARQHTPRTLVVVRNSAKRQWARAIDKWTDRYKDVHILEGSIPQQKGIALSNGWVIAHWEAMVHAREALVALPWDVVILDEAHWIRNRDAERSTTAFLLEATWRMALTAHPYNKSPEELWSILHFLYPHLYTSFWTFFSMHVQATPKPFGGWDVEGPRNARLLRWEIAPFYIRRTKRQVHRHLPPVTEIPRYLELPAGHRAEYKRINKQFFAELKTAKGKRILAIPSILARVTRMRQYLVDPQILQAEKPSIKYPEVLAIMEEMDGPPVIFTSFKQAAKRLRKYLKERGKVIGMIHGDVEDATRDKVQQKFLKGKYDAVIITTAAGSESLNFGKYGYLIFLDLPWTWLDYDQSVGRVDRPEEGTGNLVPTTVYRIIIKGTYEERLEKMVLEERKNMFEAVFTPDQLQEFFT